MRYYIYLDKNFIKTIFASEGYSDFDIDIMTYSFQEGRTISNDKTFSPRVDYSEDEFKEREKIKEVELKKDNQKNNYNENKKANSRKIKLRGDVRKRNDNSIMFSSSNSNSFNQITEKRYINIEDVSEIKNISFFHKLLTSIESKCNNCNNEKGITYNGLILEIGKIFPCNIKFNNDESYCDNNQFFYVNGKYFWIEKKLLTCDLMMLSNIKSNVYVCGFSLNKGSNFEMIKAIAIYIT